MLQLTRGAGSIPLGDQPGVKQKKCRPAGLVKWRLEYRHAASPAARLLQPRSSDPVGVFALLGRVGRSPRVFAFRDREQLLRQMMAAGSKKMGLALSGEPALCAGPGSDPKRMGGSRQHEIVSPLLSYISIDDHQEPLSHQPAVTLLGPIASWQAAWAVNSWR